MEIRGVGRGSSNIESSMKEEGLSYAMCVEEFNSKLLSPIPYLPIVGVCSMTASLLMRDFSAVRATLTHCGDHTITQTSRGEIKRG
jgi:hypothetical protein